MAIYFRDPDTPEQIELKIAVLEQEIKILEKTLSKNIYDLINNHMNYSDHIIAAKKTMLNETDRAIKSKKSKIISYTDKLKKLKK